MLEARCLTKYYSAIPANGIGAFTAQQLHDPTVQTGFERQAYFIDPSGDSFFNPSTSLVYSIGCHSGLNVVNPDIASGTPQYQYDFPSAALKQGGNWIGNTGFGYGDSDLIVICAGSYAFVGRIVFSRCFCV